MLNEAKVFLTNIHEKKPCKFVLVGPTETGKTLLNNDIKRFILKYHSYFPFPIKEQSDEYLIYATLSELTTRLLKDSSYLRTLQRCGILFIEEFLGHRVINAYTEITIEKAFEIINQRKDKPTVLDTNKSLDDIKTIDIRIYSRLFRDNGIVLSIPEKTTPYLTRVSNASKK